MMLRSLCGVVVLDGMMSVAWAEPVVLEPAQMDALTAAGDYADAVAQATATGPNAFTNTSSSAIALLDGLRLRLTGYEGGGHAAALAIAAGPSAYIEASAKAGYGAAGEAVAQAVGTGKSAFAGISAAVVTINGQDYLTGSLAGGAAPGLAFITAPIPLSTTSGTWSPPAMRPAAEVPALSVASTEVPGGLLVTYALTTGDQNGDTSTGDHATLSLTFFKPPRSHIPPMIPIGISGVVPVMSTALHAIPAAM